VLAKHRQNEQPVSEVVIKAKGQHTGYLLNIIAWCEAHSLLWAAADCVGCRDRFRSNGPYHRTDGRWHDFLDSPDLR